MISLVDRMLAGDRLALARLITRVENRMPGVAEIMRAVQPHLGRAHVLGVTGPPGAGKSTLVDRLTARLRAEGQRVGVIAVDPSSPFTGGAVLGDRIRMQAHTLDRDVFIRSMATRGSLGGLAAATGDVIKLMDAAGFPWILIETVGVGQTELDIIKQADTTVVALVPESGDSIQAMKAGLMEVADIFVVNKADRDGAHALMAELRFSVHLHYSSSVSPKDIEWEIPVLAAQATNDVGVGELLADVKRHRSVLEQTGALEKRRRARRRSDLRTLLVEEFAARVAAAIERDPELTATMDAVAEGKLDAYSGVERMLARLLRQPEP
ncbi:MAG TPA: methylmalonyl Co-A mutase-associated GTPase MeaB [Terriglobales bacterium]|nr:methylmalonyl Co-A mutase-associated GTPase MeaB [Terriglobales bacterium]